MNYKQLIIFFLFPVLMIGCNSSNPRTEILSTSVEESIATAGGIYQVIDGFRPARIEIMVYDFRKLPQVDDPTDYKAVSKWLVDYARCYQNGQELERSYYYHHEDNFIKGEQCKLTVFYQVPDDEKFDGLKFEYTLPGLEANYTEKFQNNAPPKPVIKYNDTFEILNYEGKTVTMKALVKTPIYGVSLISGDQAIPAKTTKNIKGNMVFSFGGTAKPGSSLWLPEGGGDATFNLNKGTVVECSVDKLPEGFTAEKIRVLTSKKAEPMYYDIKLKSW